MAINSQIPVYDELVFITKHRRICKLVFRISIRELIKNYLCIYNCFKAIILKIDYYYSVDHKNKKPKTKNHSYL